MLCLRLCASVWIAFMYSRYALSSHVKAPNPPLNLSDKHEIPYRPSLRASHAGARGNESHHDISGIHRECCL